MTARAWSLDRPTCLCGQPYALQHAHVTVTTAGARIEGPEVQWLVCGRCGTRAFSAATLERIENVAWSVTREGPADGA